MYAPTHPRPSCWAARRDLLAALEGQSAADLLQRRTRQASGAARDVLLHIAAWLRELARLVPDLARYGLPARRAVRSRPRLVGLERRADRAAPARCGPRRRWPASSRRTRACSKRWQPLDEAALRRRGPTRFGFEASGWDLLLAEAEHERAHAARLAVRKRRLTTLEDARCHQPGPLLRVG